MGEGSYQQQAQLRLRLTEQYIVFLTVSRENIVVFTSACSGSLLTLPQKYAPPYGGGSYHLPQKMPSPPYGGGNLASTICLKNALPPLMG